MAGRPLKRKREQTKLLRGEATERELNGHKDDDEMEVIVINRTVPAKPDESEAHESADQLETKPDEPLDISNHPGHPKNHPKKGAGGTKEYMQAMTKRRMEMAKTNPEVKGGRPRTKYSRKELEARAIDRMTPKALKILEAQLDDVKLSPRERREVAKLILEYKLGKPKQQIEQKIDQNISAIRFETAAFAGIPAIDRTLPDIEVGGGDEDDS